MSAWSLHPHDLVSLRQKDTLQAIKRETWKPTLPQDLDLHLLPWKMCSGHGGAELVVLANQLSGFTWETYHKRELVPYTAWMFKNYRIFSCFHIVRVDSPTSTISGLTVLPGVVLRTTLPSATADMGQEQFSHNYDLRPAFQTASAIDTPVWGWVSTSLPCLCSHINRWVKETDLPCSQLWVWHDGKDTKNK